MQSCYNAGSLIAMVSWQELAGVHGKSVVHIILACDKAPQLLLCGGIVAQVLHIFLLPLAEGVNLASAVCGHCIQSKQMPIGVVVQQYCLQGHARLQQSGCVVLHDDLRSTKRMWTRHGICQDGTNTGMPTTASTMKIRSRGAGSSHATYSTC